MSTAQITAVARSGPNGRRLSSHGARRLGHDQDHAVQFRALIAAQLDFEGPTGMPLGWTTVVRKARMGPLK